MGWQTYTDVAGLSVTLRDDLYVPQVKDGGQDLKDAALIALLYTWKHNKRVLCLFLYFPPAGSSQKVRKCFTQ